MKILNPLVFQDDSVQSTAATVGGGGVSIQSAIINVPYTNSGSYSTTITDASVTASSKIMMTFGSLAADHELDLDELSELEIVANPKVGQIEVVIKGPGEFGGPIPVNYLIG